MSRLTGPQKLALLGTALAVVFATIVPLLAPAAWRYDPMVAVTLVMGVAVIATAAFAADNLTEFRKATEAEYTPIIDVRIIEEWERGDSKLRVEFRNIGRGIAAGLEAAVWWLDSDLVVWLPHPLNRVVDLLRPGEQTSDDLEHPSFHAAVQKHFQPNLPDMVLQLRYRDALRRDQESFQAYGFVRDDSGSRRLLPSSQAIPNELTSIEGKRVLLETEIARLRGAYDLETHGLNLVGRVSSRTVQVAIQKEGKDVWMAQSGVEHPVYRLEEELRLALPDVISALHGEEDGR